jgi:DNA replication protein DnaC
MPQQRTASVPVYDPDDSRVIVGEKTKTWEEEVLVECAVCYARQLQERLQTGSGLLEAELSMSLDQILPNQEETARMVAMARQYQEKPWGIWTLWGSCGTGKTMVAQSLANHFREQGLESIYVRFTDMLDWMRQGYAEDAAENAVARLAQMSAVWFLAVDEFDKARATPWATEMVNSLVDARWRRGIALEAHTVFCLNKDPAVVFDKGSAVYSRLRDDRFGCILKDTWLPGITRNNDPDLREYARELA